MFRQEQTEQHPILQLKVLSSKEGNLKTEGASLQYPNAI